MFEYFGANFKATVAPLIIILLAVPMIFRKVPRNYIYGFRTVYTMSSDEVWYRANRLSGIAMLIAGVIWLILGLTLPSVRLAMWLGLACLIVAIAIASWITYGK